MKIYNGFTLALILIMGSDISSTFSIGNNLKLSSDAQSKSETRSVTPELPPLVFPVDPKAYRIVPPNETALKILQHIKDTTTSAPQQKKRVADKNGFTIFNMHVDDIPEEFPSDIATNLKEQVEDIQPIDLSRPTVELEERFHQQRLNPRAHDIFTEDIETHATKLTDGHITAILAGVLAIVSIAIFAGFLSWRSYIERRYGKRERLVNEDDYYRNNDSRHMDL